MATSGEAYQRDCMKQWDEFYEYWSSKPGCISLIAKDLWNRGGIAAILGDFDIAPEVLDATFPVAERSDSMR